MAISFPTNPVTGQTYTAAGKTWTYNGRGWASANTIAGSATVDTTTLKRINYGLNILFGR